MTETELRERLARWSDPLRATPPPPVGTIRRRARRYVAGLAVTYGVVLAILGVAAGVVAAGIGAAGRPPVPGPWGSARYPAPPGQPYIFVNDPAAGKAELRDAATGTVVKVLRPPSRGASFTAAAAAAGDRLFVLGEQAASGQITFAELTIKADHGRVTVRLAPVLGRVHLAASTELISMTVNAAGTRLALTAGPPAGQVSDLKVYNLRNGAQIGSWQPPDLTASTQQFVGRADELAVFWPMSGPVASNGGTLPLELRLVDTAAAAPPGASLLADSRADPTVSGAAGGSLSQDGSVVLNAVGGALGATTPQDPAADLLESSAVSGRQLWRVALGPASALRGPDFCGVLWASANGRDLLTQCGRRQLSVINGKASVIHLRWIFPAPRSLGITTFAW